MWFFISSSHEQPLLLPVALQMKSVLLESRYAWTTRYTVVFGVRCTHFLRRSRFASVCRLHRTPSPRFDLPQKYSFGMDHHVSLSSSLAKAILQGTVKGGKRQGRQKKKWEGNIKEWPSLESAKSQRAVENREKWRKLIVKSSVVP